MGFTDSAVAPFLFCWQSQYHMHLTARVPRMREGTPPVRTQVSQRVQTLSCGDCLGPQGSVLHVLLGLEVSTIITWRPGPFDFVSLPREAG